MVIKANKEDNTPSQVIIIQDLQELKKKSEKLIKRIFFLKLLNLRGSFLSV